MDSHIWKVVYQAIRNADRVVPRYGRRPTYSDVLIVAIYVWSVWHDRPLCWACDRTHYSSLFRPRRLPSVSQFCKRIKQCRCSDLLTQVHRCLTEQRGDDELSFLDGRLLQVGAYSKDRDARSGPGHGAWAKGYKLHAWAFENGAIPHWSVMPLNVCEKTVAKELLRCAPANGIVLADGAYDAGHLYDDVAAAGGQLITPVPKNAGRGHRPQSASRLLATHLWGGIAGYVYRDRLKVERIFGHHASYGGGLHGLPPWVRTLDRVRRWVGAKLIIYHARLTLRNERKKDAS